jgi:hypothetical protein
MKTIEASVKLHSQSELVWKSITDHEALPRHVSMLSEVKVLDPKPSGVGTVRQCTLRGGKSFHERITVWEEGHRYCYQPDPTEAPFPFRWAEACWSVQATGDGSRLSYRLQYEPRSLLKDLINYPLLRTYGVIQIKKMLRSYELPADAGK